jgi:hypothetical protein
MDLSDWNNLANSKVSFAKKKFFNEYYYRLTYYVPGARLLTHKILSEMTLLDRVQQYNARNSDLNLSWMMFRYSSRDLASFDQLKDFNEVFNAKNSGLKFRIERDTLNIYSKSDTFLYKIADVALGAWKHSIKDICVPESEQAKKILDQGYTIVKKLPTHPYRIKLKEGFPSISEKQGLGLYLKNLNDDVKITQFMLDRLAGTHKYFQGGYMYVKDPRIVDLLIMVSPTIIGTVNQMVINN